MAYGNIFADSMSMNEAVKQQAEAQRQAQIAAQRQAEQQAYERQRQAFQEQLVTQEQAHREAESKAAIDARKLEIDNRAKQFDTIAKTIGGLGSGFASSAPQFMTPPMPNYGGARFNNDVSVQLQDHNGNQIGGTVKPPAKQNNGPGYSYGQSGMSPFRQSLLGE